MPTFAKAVIYTQHGAPEVLQLVDREVPTPAAGQVLVRIVVSGINPTDWKNRQASSGTRTAETVPHQDGAGFVEAVGDDVAGFEVGERVWVVLAAYGNPGGGTAQEYAAVAEDRVFHLPDEASFDQGASIGIPGLTAYRALTVCEGWPSRLYPGALDGMTVLVAGGAGAVGHAAIQLAKWAGAYVIATVSSAEKERLVLAAGAEYGLRYNDPGLARTIRDAAPAGVDLVVEVAATVNSALDLAVLADRGTIAIYGNDRGGPFNVNFGHSVSLNLRYQFVLLYTVGSNAISTGAEDINAAFAAGALPIGADAGLPLHRFTLADTAQAQLAVERGAVGKVLVDVTSPVL
jgi:NADPH2:quinone reductase